MSYQSSEYRARAFAGAVLVAVTATAFAAPPAIETERNRAFIDGAFERWAAGGKGFFNEVLSDKTVWTIKGSGPSATVYQGRQAFMERAIRPFAARMAEPVRPVSRQVWADGDHVIVRWDGEGLAGDRRAYRNSYVWIFRMSGGRAAEVTAFLDLPAYDGVLNRVPAKREAK